jgi:hypothetical protein
MSDEENTNEKSLEKPRLRFQVGEVVVIMKGELRFQAVIKKRKPEYRMYFVLGENIPPSWVHQDQMLKHREAASERHYVPLP